MNCVFAHICGYRLIVIFVCFPVSEIDQDCTIFSGVTYLASATINAPKSETEIQRKITELNLSYDDDTVGLKVSISIPICSEGLVV